MDMMSLRRRVMINQNKLVNATGNPITFNTPLTKPLKECVVRFTPQQEGSGTPSPDNVRNISGRNSVKLWQSGKNLYPATASSSTYQTVNLKMGVDYTFSAFTEGTPYFRLKFEDDTISGIVWMRNETSDGRKYLTLAPSKNVVGAFIYLGVGLTEPMIEVGSEPTAYEPYIAPNEITFSWGSDPEIGTIYGGYVDCETADLVVKKDTLVFDGSEAWNLYRNDENTYVYLYVPGRKPLDQNEICSHFRVSSSTGNALGQPNTFVWGSGTGRVFIQVSATLASDVTAFKQFLADEAQKGTPVTIVANALNPIHYSLTPQSIATLRGNNTMWSDANGDITVRYWTR